MKNQTDLFGSSMLLWSLSVPCFKSCRSISTCLGHFFPNPHPGCSRLYVRTAIAANKHSSKIQHSPCPQPDKGEVMFIFVGAQLCLFFLCCSHTLQTHLYDKEPWEEIKRFELLKQRPSSISLSIMSTGTMSSSGRTLSEFSLPSTLSSAAAL